jgi:gluconokinase
MDQRQGHYMPSSLLDSQFADLEDPRGEPNVISIDINQTVESMLLEAQEKTRKQLGAIE